MAKLPKRVTDEQIKAVQSYMAENFRLIFHGLTAWHDVRIGKRVQGLGGVSPGGLP